MPALLADINIQGHMEAVGYVGQSPFWCELWQKHVNAIHTFAEVGLPANVSDAVLWQFCQSQQLFLVTANRNFDGPDSLEATLRTQNQPDSLPVFTLADPERVRKDRIYAERVVERLLEYLLDLEKIRGTGRLYLP